MYNSYGRNMLLSIHKLLYKKSHFLLLQISYVKYFVSGLFMMLFLPS